LQITAGAAAAFVIAGCSSHKKVARLPVTYPGGPVFGGKIDAGSLDHILASIDAKHAPYYIPEARAYISRFPTNDVAAAKAHYPAAVQSALDAGVIVLYQRCTHLGCRVPFCDSSQWFECPCHAAYFDRVGEHRAGPAPRGLDLMAANVESGHLVIDSATIVHGLPDGTDTTHQELSGPHCT